MHESRPLGSLGGLLREKCAFRFKRMQGVDNKWNCGTLPTTGHAGRKERTIMEATVKNLAIHYEEYGRGQPILLIHGYTVDHRLMSGCLEPVFGTEPGYRRIYIDLPGMGMTKSAPWITNSDVMLDIVLEFIDQVIPGERFLLAGESYGGYLARGVVNKIPDRVAGVYLLCPAIIPDHDKRIVPEHKVIKADEALLKQLDTKDAEDFAEVHVIQTAEMWQAFRDDVLPGIRIADMPFLHWFRTSGFGFTFEVDRLEKPYTEPSLILLGRQDASVGYRDAWQIIENHPRAAFVVLDRSGHNLQIEQPELHASLVKEWLFRVRETMGLE